MSFKYTQDEIDYLRKVVVGRRTAEILPLMQKQFPEREWEEKNIMYLKKTYKITAGLRSNIKSENESSEDIPKANRNYEQNDFMTIKLLPNIQDIEDRYGSISKAPAFDKQLRKVRSMTATLK